MLPRPPFFFSRAIELYVPPWRPPQPPALLPLATYYRGRAQCQVCGAGLPFRACRDGWFFLLLLPNDRSPLPRPPSMFFAAPPRPEKVFSGPIARFPLSFLYADRVSPSSLYLSFHPIARGVLLPRFRSATSMPLTRTSRSASPSSRCGQTKLSPARGPDSPRRPAIPFPSFLLPAHPLCPSLVPPAKQAAGSLYLARGDVLERMERFDDALDDYGVAIQASERGAHLILHFRFL